MSGKAIMRTIPVRDVTCIDKWRCPVENWQSDGRAVIGRKNQRSHTRRRFASLSQRVMDLTSTNVLSGGAL